jgi:putative oxidoreductase
MIYIPSNKIILTLSILLGLAFLVFGGMKFLSPQELLDNFETWGYPSGFHYLVGLAEVGGAVALFIRPLSKWGALLLGVVMTGAFITHVMNPPVAAGIPSVVLGAMAYTTAVLHFKTKSEPEPSAE